ncbi:serine hydrolase domain-containing protein [Sinomonas sp. ASV486]|uniref:serine hydrolase domain-containing protein n=1 Tax=Sinomonas sp. ASV486 TaxID=3051170 RepID=UPI0027DBFEE2|nr:serine hydrolase domain-containing protein [Sinomonas sp. ASV486]MDQ4489945.1 serine hydrolase domain-containing protein [Sinomonas sp. ASV486]
MGHGTGASRRTGGLRDPRRGRRPHPRRRRLVVTAIAALVVLAAGTAAFVGIGAEENQAEASHPAPAAASGGRDLPTTPPTAKAPASRSTKPKSASPAPSSPTAPAGAAPSAAGSAQPAWQTMPAAIADAVDAYAEDQGAAGIAVAVSTGTGATAQARYLATTGQSAADTPWSTDTRSAFRSITKSFVGTVVLQLVGEGKLGLDDPVSTFVPSVAQVQYDGAAAGGQITVREALEMRTGLTEFSGTQEFSDQLDADYTRAFTDDELLGYAFDEPLDFAPGTQYAYSNTNYVLLGAIIQSITGQPWDQAVQSRILGPLGLTSVAYSGSAQPAAPVATPYEFSDAGLESLAQVSPSLYGASGGYFGTIGDLLSWGRALGSGALVTPALQQARFTAVSDPETEDPGSPDYSGYGLAAGTIDGWWGHTGTGLGYESLTMYNPATGMTISILINTQLPNPNGPAVLFKQLEQSLAALS